MLRMNTRLAIQVALFSVGLCLAGSATAQEGASISTAPDGQLQENSQTISVATGIESGGAINTINTAETFAPERAKGSAPRMTWDSAAPELDAFGNETVPIFNSTYSAR
jgi:hypothetical protein